MVWLHYENPAMWATDDDPNPRVPTGLPDPEPQPEPEPEPKTAAKAKPVEQTPATPDDTTTSQE